MKWIRNKMIWSIAYGCIALIQSVAFIFTDDMFFMLFAILCAVWSEGYAVRYDIETKLEEKE